MFDSCDPMDYSQAPLSMGFSRQEYWSGLPFLPPRIFPTQESKLGFPLCTQILYQLITGEEKEREEEKGEEGEEDEEEEREEGEGRRRGRGQKGRNKEREMWRKERRESNSTHSIY